MVMVRLKVTAKGQVTLKKEVLDHLGIKPGDEIDVDLRPKRQRRFLITLASNPATRSMSISGRSGRL